MLKLRNIKKTFYKGTINEKIALNGVNLTIEDGDFITVIGGNGAGKSTLLNSIAGTFKIDEGSIYLNDVDLTPLPEYKRAPYLGRVFQDPMMGTAGDMEIIENMALANRRGLKRRLRWSVNKEEAKFFEERVATLDLGLEKRMHSKVGLLSGGQRQALTLLMATLRKPELLLLDEHTAALDPKTAKKVLKTTCDMVESGNITTLMITHNMRDAISIGNRLIMMYDGQIIYDVKGEEKSKLTTDLLLDKFDQASDGEFSSDRVLLTK